MSPPDGCGDFGQPADDLGDLEFAGGRGQLKVRARAHMERRNVSKVVPRNLLSSFQLQKMSTLFGSGTRTPVDGTTQRVQEGVALVGIPFTHFSR